MKCKNMSLGIKTGLPIVILLALGAIVNIGIAGIVTKNMMVEEIKNGEIEGYRNTVLNALTTMMITGNMKEAKPPFLEQMKNLIDLRLIRSAALIKDFGEGGPGESSQDAIEKEVISSGKEQILVDDKYVRGVYPYIAKANFMGKNCLQCHNVREGEVLGAISIKVPLERTLDRIRSLEYIFAGLGLLGVLGIAVAVFLIVKITHKPLTLLQKDVELIADGDLTVRADVDSKDEIGCLADGFNHMVDKLRSIVVSVQTASDTMFKASNGLNDSSSKMSFEVTDQAEKTTQIATSIEEMSQTLVDIAKNTASIASSASNTLKVAEEGASVVGNTIREVNQIKSSVTDSSGFIESLGQRSNQIGDIVNVINDIADQTNLLALNAAIEAARAGEQGRGFAVVADEVRKLAEKTGKATTEISEMIKAIQAETQKTIGSMEETLHRVESGVQYSTSAGVSLNSIVESARELHSMSQSIAAATEEMSAVADQVNRDVDFIASGTRNTSLCSEIVNTATGDLVQISVKLKEIVSQFRLNTKHDESGYTPKRLT